VEIPAFSDLPRNEAHDSGPSRTNPSVTHVDALPLEATRYDPKALAALLASPGGVNLVSAKTPQCLALLASAAGAKGYWREQAGGDLPAEQAAALYAWVGETTLALSQAGKDPNLSPGQRRLLLETLPRSFDNLLREP
jgi:hypothetical protein